MNQQLLLERFKLFQDNKDQLPFVLFHNFWHPQLQTDLQADQLPEIQQQTEPYLDKMILRILFGLINSEDQFSILTVELGRQFSIGGFVSDKNINASKNLHVNNTKRCH